MGFSVNARPYCTSSSTDLSRSVQAQKALRLRSCNLKKIGNLTLTSPSNLPKNLMSKKCPHPRCSHDIVQNVPVSIPLSKSNVFKIDKNVPFSCERET